jgi:hypothetical protein
MSEDSLAKKKPLPLYCSSPKWRVHCVPNPVYELVDGHRRSARNAIWFGISPNSLGALVPT